MTEAGYRYKLTAHGPSTSALFYKSPRLGLASSTVSQVPTTVTVERCVAQGQGMPVYANFRLGANTFTVTNVHWITGPGQQCPRKESVPVARRLLAELRFGFVKGRLKSYAGPDELENDGGLKVPISNNLIIVGQMGGPELDEVLLPFREFGFVLATEVSRLNPSSGIGSYRQGEELAPLQHILVSPAVAGQLVPYSSFYLPSYSEFSAEELAAFRSEVTKHAPVWTKIRLSKR